MTTLELYDENNHIYLLNGEKVRLNDEEISHLLLPYLKKISLKDKIFNSFDINMHLIWYFISDNEPIDCVFYSLETEKCWIVNFKIEIVKDKMTIHTPFENIKTYKTEIPEEEKETVSFGENVGIKEVDYQYFLGKEITEFTILSGIWLDSKIIYIDNESIVCRNSETKKAQTYWKQGNGKYLEDVIMKENERNQKRKDRLNEIGKTVLKIIKK